MQPVTYSLVNNIQVQFVLCDSDLKRKPRGLEYVNDIKFQPANSSSSFDLFLDVLSQSIITPRSEGSMAVHRTYRKNTESACSSKLRNK